MSRYKEVVNQPFQFHTKATVYGSFADIKNPQEQAIMPFQHVGQNGFCHLRMLRREKLTTVIATEIPENPGKTVTNAAVEIATQVVAAFQLEPTQARFIEHYTPESYEGSAEAYDEVSFDWQGRRAKNPQWRRLQPHEVAELNDTE